jgi:hypothetical protein
MMVVPMVVLLYILPSHVCLLLLLHHLHHHCSCIPLLLQQQQQQQPKLPAGQQWQHPVDYLWQQLQGRECSMVSWKMISQLKKMIRHL